MKTIWKYEDIVDALRDMAEIEGDLGEEGSTGYEALVRAANSFEDEGKGVPPKSVMEMGQ